MKLGFLRIYLTYLWKQLNFFLNPSIKFLCCTPFSASPGFLQDVLWSSCDALLLCRSHQVPWTGAAGLGQGCACAHSPASKSNPTVPLTPHISFLYPSGHSHKTQKFPSPTSPQKAVPHHKPTKILSVLEISFKVYYLASKFRMRESMKNEQMMWLYKSTFIKKTGLEILVEPCW